jgi:hypothetical protein
MSSESLGKRAAAALKAAKVKAQHEGRTMSWDEVALIIDGCMPTEGIMPPPGKADSGQSCASTAVRGQKSGPASPFGDRKKIPPTPEQVEAYSASIGYPMNGQAWCDAYAQKGWKVGAKRMVDWQAAVRNWKTSGYGQDGIALSGGVKPSQPKNYSKI